MRFEFDDTDDMNLVREIAATIERRRRSPSPAAPAPAPLPAPADPDEASNVVDLAKKAAKDAVANLTRDGWRRT